MAQITPLEHVEQTLDFTVPQNLQEIWEVAQIIPQERVEQQTGFHCATDPPGNRERCADHTTGTRAEPHGEAESRRSHATSRLAAVCRRSRGAGNGRRESCAGRTT